ncbi:MAG: hypothetical protein Unbinned5350contig1004_58 [Prokaryotic dsDNA virus sp.]|nr:MAG: hypothetical protein Unbinned5350contig1004_58 [Prokaryotic dsDNA virus sp.]|tara:strand:+ start:10692 stop:10874 length:183 start_codon:yes stop_codon:yes gene_type:complete
MTEKLVVIKGYKLPGEKVWVTTQDMHEVYGRINLSIDDEEGVEMIIVDIKDEGLVVESLQ